MPSLVLIADGRETRYDLAGSAVVVGRSVECDVQVSDEKASRRHFTLEPSDRGWILRDLESSNGTALNGYGVSRALLTPGDVIEVGGDGGGTEFRFEGEGPVAAPRIPRAQRKRPSTGPVWVAGFVAFLAVAVGTDQMAVEAARDRDAELRTARAAAAHAEYLVASRQTDPVAGERLLAAWLEAHPGSLDAAGARARLDEIRGTRLVRDAAAADWEALRAAALSPEEYRWRLESLVRRWSDSPEALAEIRARVAAAPREAPAPEDTRVLFQRRKREADEAAAAGELGKAIALWGLLAQSLSATDPVMDEVRAEVRALEKDASARAADLVSRAAALGAEGKGDEALSLLRAAAGPLAGTGGGRRVAARLDAGLGVPGAALAAGPAAAGGAEGYARKRALYLEARDAEQFVAIRDYAGAATQYASIAAAAGEFPEIRAAMEARAAWLSRVNDLLKAVRDLPGGWRGKPFPEGWDAVPAAELGALLLRVAKKPEDRLALASYAYDQGLRAQALEAVCAALDNPATHDEAERLYAAREGIPVPTGGFVAEKGEVITRDEWKRRRNAEAIRKGRERQAVLLRKLNDTGLVKGIARIAELRAELDRRRAYALELIFDEVRYFYPYQGRMAEYAPVQQEVDRRVEAVREVWNDRTRFRTKPDSGTAQVLKDFDEVAKQLRELGAEAGPEEAEVARLRTYLDRDLDVRSYFKGPEDLAFQEYSAGVMRENAGRTTVADEPERRQVEVTNEYRVMFGRRALLIEDRLVLSSRAHGDDMSRGGFFSHFNERLRGMKPGEKIPPQACGCSGDGFVPGCGHGPDARIRKQGYDFIACSENIHAGSGDPEGAHRGWIHSSGHHRNILTTEWREMGTGRVGKYWTQNFGLPLDRATALPSDGAGSSPWDRAGGRGTGGDGNDPEER